MIGATVGFAASKLTSYFDDHLLEITLTTITAYGAFLLAQSVHVSPVIAVLAAGLVIGNYGRERAMSSTTQVAVNSFWEYAAFVVNSLVFLLIGLEFRFGAITQNLRVAAWSVAAMLVARAVAVYGLMPLVNLRSKRVAARLAACIVLGWSPGFAFDCARVEPAGDVAGTRKSGRDGFQCRNLQSSGTGVDCLEPASVDGAIADQSLDGPSFSHARR